jgi:site-specific DNA-methyltransferase (cytosine-N4-specific)
MRILKEVPSRPSRAAIASHVVAAVSHGDAYDLMRRLEPESVDLVITSPPYWGHRSYDQTHNWSILHEWRKASGDSGAVAPYDWYRKHGGVLGLEPYPEWYVQHLVEILGEAKNSLRSQGSMWINIGDTYFARWSSIRERGRQGLGESERERRRVPMGGYRQEKQLLLIPARYAIAMQDHGWILRNDLIWHKPNVPPRPETDRLRLAHEHFFHFVRRPKVGRAKYYYNISDVEPGARDVVQCLVRSGENGHSATFPEEIIRPRILSSCPPGGLVLDPFCGTGRALTVALESGRRAVGFEISDAFARAAREAISVRTTADGVFEP